MEVMVIYLMTLDLDGANTGRAQLCVPYVIGGFVSILQSPAVGSAECILDMVIWNSAKISCAQCVCIKFRGEISLTTCFSFPSTYVISSQFLQRMIYLLVLLHHIYYEKSRNFRDRHLIHAIDCILMNR
jgi:hypothetical protein